MILLREMKLERRTGGAVANPRTTISAHSCALRISANNKRKQKGKGNEIISTKSVWLLLHCFNALLLFIIGFKENYVYLNRFDLTESHRSTNSTTYNFQPIRLLSGRPGEDGFQVG